MSLISISADLPNIDSVIKAYEKAGQGALPYTKEAIRTATEIIQRTWIEYASGVTVSYSGGTFKINVVSGEYIRSIQDGVRFPDDLTGEVFTEIPYASIIEEGQRARDMKPALLASSKAKVSKKGTRFITVPFRHGTPDTLTLPPMPKHIYEQAQQLAYSRVNNKLVAFFTRRKYTWGGRLPDTDEGMRTHVQPHAGAGYTWKSGKYSGMVRMGNKRHSQYLTFRRVSENSDPASWQHPGVKPRPVTEAVAENTKEEVLNLIRRGFELDLYFIGE